LCAGLDDAAASAILGVEAGGLAWWYAAARECFEEAGLLMAQPVTDQVAARLPEYRRRVQAGVLSLQDVLVSERLRIGADRMHYWAHWITPEGPPRRFDTRFFLARAPEGQFPLHDGRELTASQWITPAAALERARTGLWTMVLPTLRNLAGLTGYRTTHEAEAAARNRKTVPTIAPVTIRDESGMHFVIPGEESGGGSDRT
jgi:8-oxo-dGTP pyrophosphatase MutT (NUDIX family)